jgi:capsular exopolysaccharide synthesis family protein
VSKIRDAMRKAEGERWHPDKKAESGASTGAKSEGPRGLVPPLTGDVLAHYEAVGKQVEVALGPVTTCSLLFTGAVAGDGISTVTSQYAEMLSRRGERVLMIDGNPRHPTLHRTFHLPDSPGLAEYVGGTAPREAVIHPTGFANLSLVPLGRCADRSEAGRITEALGEFQQAVAEDYDYVLTDTDYIGSPFFSQTAVSAADGVILVIRAGKTNRQVAARALETVRQVDGRVLGVILNRREFPIPNFLYRRL